LRSQQEKQRVEDIIVRNKMTAYSLSVVIPVYNEEDCIEETLAKIQEFLNVRFQDYEILVVDDGSDDGTYLKVKALAEKNKRIQLFKNDRNSGKGFSVKRGMLAATSDFVLFMDADCSTPVEEIMKFVPYFSQDIDILLGSRVLKESNVLKRQGVIRRSLGRLFNCLIQIFLFQGVQDTQCGFKCFKRQAAQKLFKLQTIQRYCFDAEILFLARKRNCTIKEIPITWVNRKNSRLGIIKDAPKMLSDLLKIRWNDWKGIYADSR